MKTHLEKVKIREIEAMVSDGPKYMIGFRERQNNANNALRNSKGLSREEIRGFAEEAAFMNQLFNARFGGSRAGQTNEEMVDNAEIAAIKSLENPEIAGDSKHG